MDATALIERYLIGDITEEDVRTLNELLASDPALRQQFVLAAATDSSLREIAQERAVESIRIRNAPPHRHTGRRLLWLALAVTAILVMVAAPAMFRPKTVAALASSEDAAWESTLPTTPGSELIPGLLHLKAGVATIRFHSGAEVLLEAPAELELISPMRGRLHSGAALIDVPDSAIGFVLETPGGYAVDYGTRFAVRVNSQEQQADFELIEGEIAVHNPHTGDEVRLDAAAQTARLTHDALRTGNADTDAAAAAPAESSPPVIRIGTNGRFGSAIRNNRRKKFIDPQVLSVKRTNSGKWDHRSFFEFDLTDVDLSRVTAARLRLNLVPSTRGLASRLPKVNVFGVYGLTNPARANWQPDCLWEESPGPEDGVLLGTFEIPRSQQRGSFGIENEALLRFLQDHQGETVTLILVRETTQIAGTGPGLTHPHQFASDLHPETVGPILELSVAETP